MSVTIDARAVARAATLFPERCVEAAIFAPMLQLATDHGYGVFDIPDSWLRLHALEKSLVVEMLTARGFGVVHGYDGITAMASRDGNDAAPNRPRGSACVISSTTLTVEPRHGSYKSPV